MWSFIAKEEAGETRSSYSAIIVNTGIVILERSAAATIVDCWLLPPLALAALPLTRILRDTSRLFYNNP
jgi:hypothetical protein